MVDLQIETLRDLVSGPVFTRHDEGFEAEAQAWNLAVTQHPEIIVGATSTEDVVAAVRFAHSTGRRVTVQATGHGAHVPITSGVLITTSRLDTVSIDPESRIATVGAGVQWQRVIDAAAPFGLSPIAGSSTAVGVVGYTLGGGLGPLSRSHGFSSDYLRGATVVSGDGRLIDVDATSNPDLLWAVRGGKYGLGIVTAVRLELVAMTELYAGSLYFDTQHIESVLRGWINYTAVAPNSVTTSIAILRLPDIEVVPPPLRGRTLANVRFAYPGAANDGARLAEPVRSLAPVYLDLLGDMPPTEVARIHADPIEPSVTFTRGGMLDSADQQLATVILRHVGPQAHIPLTVFELRHLGGATHIDVEGGSAVGGRDANFTVVAIGAPDRRLFDEVLPQLINPLFADLAPWLSAITTVNFLTDADTPEALASAWPAPILARLTEIRKHYNSTGTVTPFAITEAPPAPAPATALAPESEAAR